MFVVGWVVIGLCGYYVVCIFDNGDESDDVVGL